MSFRRPWPYIMAGLFLLLSGSEALAWGPGTHVKLACDLLGGLWALPGALAAVLARHASDFVFGNVAADIVFAKRLCRVKQFCHHWTTGFDLLETADSDKGRAFAYGYIAHLAADTVAHNKFLPRQMTATRSTISFGHFYWEARADHAVADRHWRTLRDVLTERFREHEPTLADRMQQAWLPFRLNRGLFSRMTLLSCQESWRRGVELWDRLSRWDLSDELLAAYRAECQDRIVSVLTELDRSSVVLEDPSGNAMLGYARVQRRQMRRMARVGLLLPHVIHEALAGHEPAAQAGVAFAEASRRPALARAQPRVTPTGILSGA